MKWKMVITNALNVTQSTLVVISRTARCVSAVANSGLLSSAVLRILWMIMGVILGMVIFMSQESESVPVSDDQRLFRVIGHYKKQVARRDVILNHFMGGTWDSDCDYDLVPEVRLADDSIRFTLFQICEEIKEQ